MPLGRNLEDVIQADSSKRSVPDHGKPFAFRTMTSSALGWPRRPRRSVCVAAALDGRQSREETPGGRRSRLMTKTEPHRLVDELPESTVRLAAGVLQAIRDEADPLLSFLENVPVDDDPVPPEEEAAIEEALEDVRAGRLIPHEEVWKRLESER
jgi:hypothetical protein